MRQAKPCSIQAAIRATITNAGGLDVAAADMEISTTTLSRATDIDEARPGGLGVNYLHRLARLAPHSVAPIAHHFAQLSGGYFVPINFKASQGADISAVMDEFSKVLSYHSAVHSSDTDFPFEYTAREARIAAEGVGKLMEAAARFQHSLMQNAHEQEAAK